MQFIGVPSAKWLAENCEITRISFRGTEYRIDSHGYSAWYYVEPGRVPEQTGTMTWTQWYDELQRNACSSNRTVLGDNVEQWSFEYDDHTTTASVRPGCVEIEHEWYEDRYFDELDARESDPWDVYPEGYFY